MTIPHRANLDCNRPTPGLIGNQQTAERRLLGSGYTALSTVHCAFHDGLSHVLGLVHTFHNKQVALALVADIDGVHVVSY